MERNHLILGGIALVVGLLLGLLFAPRGASVEEIDALLQERIAAVEGAAAGTGESVTALQTQMEGTTTGLQTQIEETMSNLESRFAEIGERLAQVESVVGENAAAQATMAETLRSELSGGLETLGSSLSAQSEQLQSGLEGFRQSLAMDDLSTEGGHDAGAAQGETPASEGTAAQPAEVEADESGEGEFAGIGAGQTALFADGMLRAFVSRVDPQTQAVRLSVNGATAVMAVGESVGVTTDDGTFCRLMLSGVQDNQAAVNAACGDDLPVPEGVTPGNVLLLADGSVRIFVSGVGDDARSARVAVNGVQTQTMEVGQSIEVTANEETCEVTLDDIDRGHVALSTTCGG